MRPDFVQSRAKALKLKRGIGISEFRCRCWYSGMSLLNLANWNRAMKFLKCSLNLAAVLLMLIALSSTVTADMHLPDDEEGGVGHTAVVDEESSESAEDATVVREILSEDQIMIVLEDYPEVTFDPEVPGGLLELTEAEVRAVAEALTALPEILEAWQEAVAPDSPERGERIPPPGGYDDGHREEPSVARTLPGGGWLLLTRHTGPGGYREYVCTQVLVVGFYEIVHEIDARGNSYGYVDYKNHDSELDEVRWSTITLGSLIGAAGKSLGLPGMVIGALAALPAGLHATVRERGYEDWVSADSWSYYGYQYLDLDAQYDIRFRVGDYTRWWHNASPRPDCSVGPIR